jgi:hypothetical protein
MPQITIEYMIMIPILIMQIFPFPLTAGLIMNGWVDSRRTLALKETASHLASSVQQLYSSLNHATISAGNVTNKLDTPPFIEGYPYQGNATLRTSLDPTLNSSKILDITLRLMGTSIEATGSVTLGQDVLWQNSTFMSNSTYASINAEKQSNGVIRLSFGGSE